MANNVTEEQLDKVVFTVVTEFNVTLNVAQDIIANDKATQEQVDASFARLAAAMHMLQFYKGDKAELESLITSTNDLVEGNYTLESWQTLVDALEKANTVLTKALEGLEVNSGSKVDTSTLVKPGDTTVSVKTGDETSLGMLMSLVGLSVLGLVYSKRKRESI